MLFRLPSTVIVQMQKYNPSNHFI